MSVKEVKLFTPESFVEFARNRVIVRALVTRTCSRDQVMVHAASCTDDHMIHVMAGEMWGYEFNPALEGAKKYLRYLDQFCGPSVKPSSLFLHEAVQAVAAVRVGMSVATPVPASAVSLLATYGQVKGELVMTMYYAPSGNKHKEPLRKLDDRFGTFLEQMVQEATKNLSALLG